MRVRVSFRPRASAGFTLVEIMITLAIMMIVMGVGIPSMYRAMQKNDLMRATRDTVEGCKTARDRAILTGTPYEFVVKQSGELDVQAAKVFTASESAVTAQKVPAGSTYDAFPRKLGEDVMIELIGVNFVDLMQEPEARVRFYPNGTCDEFSVVYRWKGEQREITMDIITGMPKEPAQ